MQHLQRRPIGAGRVRRTARPIRRLQGGINGAAARIVEFPPLNRPSVALS
jgi:hypothetical protein